MKNFKMKTKSIGFKALAAVVAMGAFFACQDDDLDSGNDLIIDYSYPLIASGQTSTYNDEGEEVYNLSEGDATITDKSTG